MKKFVIASFLCLLASPVLAKDIDFKGCTSDHKAVVLKLDINDNIAADHKEIIADIQKVFAAVAAKFSVEDLQDHDGFVAFVGGLSDDDQASIEHFYGPPQVSGECK